MTTLALTNAAFSKPSISKGSPGSPLYENATQFAGLTGNLIGAAVGISAGIGAGSLDAVIPGHNIPDGVAKFFTFAGFGTAIFFFVKLIRQIFKLKNTEVKHVTPTTLTNKNLVKDIGKSTGKVYVNPDKALHLSQDILNGTADNDTITASRNLFVHWTNEEIRRIAQQNRGRSEKDIDNGNGFNAKINLSDLSDRLAVLAGYIGLTQDTKITNSDGSENSEAYNKPLTTILNNYLSLNSIEEGGEKFKLDYLIPNEFAMVCSAGMAFKKRYSLYTDDNAINNLIQNISNEIDSTSKLTDIKKLKEAFRVPMGEENNKAKEILERFKLHYNYLKTLQQALEYVTTAEGQELSIDKARNVAVLRAALITGLDIKIKSVVSVNDQLKMVLKDCKETSLSPIKKGLTKKVSELEDILSKLQESQGEGSISINTTREDKTHGNIFSYPKGELIVFKGLIEKFD